MAELYYKAPSDDIFEEVKKEATAVWGGYDDTHGYATGKIDRIKDIKNVKDNVMYMVAMFDGSNQSKLANKLSSASRKAIRERMIDGGSPEWIIKF